MRLGYGVLCSGCEMQLGMSVVGVCGISLCVVCGVMGMCVHRVGDWVAGEWNHCPVDRELPWACGRG
jgi:hypothetical protein